ncbi:MAG: choice-of-anchor J domain-containing protein, partial [Anaerolineales bacterium]|nr:choice-of-anchor J domain-containing protein [Anaerolineales bacterium]
MKHRRIFLVLLALVLALSLLTASLVFAGPDQAESSGNAAEQGKEQAEKESDVQAPASGGAIEAVPAGWATIDNAGSGNLWRFSDEIGDGNQTTANGGTGSSIAADVPGTTNSTAWDTELWSPAIDLSASTAATLTYASQFQDFAANGEIWLDISTDGGANWTNLRNQTVDDPTGGTFEIEDLTAYVGSSVILRWRFQASASTMWFWHVDNVTVSDNTGTLLFEDFSPPPAPDLSTSSKSATPANLFVGDNISYTIIISNSGNLTTSMTMMTDTIPAGTTYVSGSVTCSLGSCAYNAGGDYISWSGDIGINQQAVIDFAVMSTQAGPVTNNADVSDSTFGPLMLSASSSVWDTVNFFTDFEADNGGLIGDNEWEWGMPTPPTSPVAYSGSNLWGTDLDNDYDASTTSVLTFTVDLSGLAGSPAVSLNWWEWFMVENCCDELFVRGSSASVPSTVLYGSTTGGPTPDQEAHEGVWFNAGIDITQFAGELATFTFHMQPDGSVHDAGWYIDDLAIYSVNPPPVSVLLNKTVGTDPSACATSNSIVVGPNTDVTYCYEILNTGAVTLTLHDLSDTELGSILSGFAYTLTPGASVWLTTTANLTQTTVNTATWTAYNAGPTDVAMSMDTAMVTVIPPAPLVCNGPAATFDAGIPIDWTVVDDSAGGGILWTTTADTVNCGIANLTNGSGEAACADSDNAGASAPAYDTSLVSSPFDLTGYSLYGLNVAAYYRDLGAGNDLFQIDVWDGSTWTNELTWDENHQPGDIFLDLSAYAGTTDAQVRFRYAGDGYDWYAQVDDVSLSCLPGTVDISLTKTVGTDPATCATDDTIIVSGGTEVYYCYEVTNNGTITATVHDLDDDRLGNIFSGVAYDLAPGASIDTVALGLTINATINTTTTNTATWTAYNGLFSAIATDTATVNVRQPIAQLDTTSIDETISTGEMTDVIITLDNVGNDPLTWSVVEEGGTRQLGRDIGTAWETMAPMPSARVFGAVIADGSGYVYVIGGTSDAGALTPTDTVFRYDTATNTWATMAAMPAALDSIDGIVIKDKIYIPGGDLDNNTYVYDIATDSWSTIATNNGFTG